MLSPVLSIAINSFYHVLNSAGNFLSLTTFGFPTYYFSYISYYLRYLQLSSRCQVLRAERGRFITETNKTCRTCVNLRKKQLARVRKSFFMFKSLPLYGE